MTAVALDWRTDTGPLPAIDRPRQPRDRRGRFAELPPLPVRIRRGDPVCDPTGVTVTSYEADNYTPVTPRRVR